VLDFATGTGIWAVEFAQQNPASTVIGSDLSLIQPRLELPNCSFVREDMEEPWVHEPGSFDYIHARWIYTCLTLPETVIQSAFEALAPGGWLELQDGDPFVQGGDTLKMKMAIDLFIAGATTIGRDFRVARRYKGLLEGAGCRFISITLHCTFWFLISRANWVSSAVVDVQEFILPLPYNESSTNPILKKVGAYMARQSMDHLHAILFKVVQLTGLSMSEMDELVSECKREICDPSLQIYGLL
jgi:SAM-dependent methyltransferase